MRGFSSAALVATLLAGCQAPTGGARGRITFFDETESLRVTVVGPITATTTTERDGNWLVRGLPAGTYAAMVDAPHTAEHHLATTFEVVAHRIVDTEPLRFTPVGTISGHLVGISSSTSVSVSVVGGTSTRTAPDGSFSLVDVAAGKHDVVLVAPGFEARRVADLEVRRGETTRVDDVSLTPLDAQLPRFGSARGMAVVHGQADQSGIVVEVEGSALQTQTATDGSFQLDDVPAGVVTLRFSRGLASVRLPSVLILSGATGFILDHGVFPLDAQPIPLRRGERVFDGPASPVFIEGEQAVLVDSAGASWLFDATKGPRLLTSESLQPMYPSAATGLGLTPHAVRLITVGHHGQGPRLLSIDRDTLEATELHAWSSPSDIRRVHVSDQGLAWFDAWGKLSLQGGQGPPTSPIDRETRSLVALRDGTLLVAAQDALLHYRLDGSLVDQTSVVPGVAVVSISGDERFVLVSGPSGPLGVVDRDTASYRALNCAFFSLQPSTHRGLCWNATAIEWVDLETGARSLAGAPDARCWGAEWFGDTTVMWCNPRTRVGLYGRHLVDIQGEAATETDAGAIRLLANIDPLTGLGEVVDVQPQDGTIQTVARDVVPQPFVALANGALVARRRPLGSDVDFSFVSPGHAETALGRLPARDLYFAVSPQGTFVSGYRLRGADIERWVLNTVTREVTTISGANGYAWWLGEGVLLSNSEQDPPLSALSGTFVVKP